MPRPRSISMIEPLSVAASVAGLISLGIQVTQSLVSFYNAYENRDSDLVHIIERLDSPAIKNDSHANIVVGSARYLHLVLDCPSSTGKRDVINQRFIALRDISNTLQSKATAMCSSRASK